MWSRYYHEDTAPAPSTLTRTRLACPIALHPVHPDAALRAKVSGSKGGRHNKAGGRGVTGGTPDAQAEGGWVSAGADAEKAGDRPK